MNNIEFNQYANLAAYEAAAKPTTASRISEIADSGKMVVDGVNIVTTEPIVGDVLFLDEFNTKVYIKGGDWLQRTLIPSGWTLVGYVFWRSGNKVRILDKNVTSLKYAAYAEYSITAISSTDITIKLRLSNDYSTYTSISVSLADTSLNATNAAAIHDAIAAKCTEVSATNVPWAYYDETNNKIVIVVAWNNYQQYNCSGTGCSISLSIWGDMPASSNRGFRINGIADDNLHSMNVARSAIYYSTNGRTPEANVAVNASASPVNKTAFENSEYCATLRAAYGTYATYIKKEYKVMYPQILGAFNLPDADYLTKKYGNRTVVLANGNTAYAFPALHQALTIGYNCDGMREGDWHLSGIDDGCIYMDDEVLAKIAASQSKMGTTVLSNSANRWFAQRGNAYNAWAFYGSNGALSGVYVYGSYQVQAVLLLSL